VGESAKDAVPALIQALQDPTNKNITIVDLKTPFRLFIINSPNRQFPNGQFHYSAHTDLVNVSAYYCCD